MNYETFKQVVLERLSYDIPDPKRISIQSVRKNNGVELDGLVIMEADSNISPTLYLNYYYDTYLEDCSFFQVYNMIIQDYEKNKPSTPVDPEFFENFENIRSRIVFKLINFEKNKKLLSDIPHIPFLDLAVVFYCLIKVDDVAGNASILIHNTHMDFWHSNTLELYRLALENAQKLMPSHMVPIAEAMEKLLQQEEILQTFPHLTQCSSELYPMYIVTNSSNLYGAGCLLYPQLLKTCADKLKSDLYVLPSSVHEVILVPANTLYDQDSLSKMVADINRTEVREDEILADHAYYYNREANRLTL